MMDVRGTWNKLINNGVSDELEFSKKKKIRLANLAVIVFIPIIIFFTAINIVSGLFDMVAILAAAIVPMLLTYYFNYKQRDQLAVLTLFCTAAIFTYFTVYLNIEQGPIPFLFISMGIAIYYWIDISWLRTLLFFVCIGSFLFLNYYQVNNLPIASEGLYYTAILYFIAVFFGLQLFNNDHEHYRKVVDQKNSELKRKQEILEDQARKLTQLNEFRSRFFANISHEFRTPLTLIKGPLEELREDEQLKSSAHLDSIENQQDRLLNLVNQILDLSEIQSIGLRPELSRVDVGNIVNEICEKFRSYAVSHQQTYTIDIPVASQEGFLDIDKLEKVISNLLSNAFKFSGENGKIDFQLRYFHNPDLWIELNISDKGQGIKAEDIENIYDQFYHSKTGTEASSGIGLALVKEIIDAQKGHIEVKSEWQKGTSFKVLLPANMTHFSDHHIEFKEVENRSIDTSIPKISLPEESIIEEVNEEELGQQHLLVIDDNPEIRSFLNKVLSKAYKISLAKDGSEGISMAQSIVPDLIISDIMMPEVDGIELTKRLKEDIKTSHIPIILLTARTGEKTRLEGFEAGSDHFLEKPFSKRELMLKINNLFAYRENVRARYCQDIILAPKVDTKDVEMVFLDKLTSFIHENIGNSEMSVEEIGTEIGLSRSQLYRKVNGITGLSVSQFIRKIRLKYAHDLISQNTGTVSEIAYECGFTSPGYFSRCFKEMYNYSPTDLLNT